MRLSKPALFIFLVLILNVINAVEGKAVTSEQIVGVGGGGPATSVAVRRGGCENQGFECKEGNGGSGDTSVLENEDYVYTNSLP